jgi:ubiquinone biosynthesis monooxygenase Coq7
MTSSPENSSGSASNQGALPGDMSDKERLDQMIRVNHAGEYGAKRIYAGQLFILKNHACAPIIEHMAQQEEEHLAYFADQIVKRGTRPTALLPLWHAAGFALGAATALLGERAAFACTVAVEDVIDQHYQEQLKELKDCKEEASLAKNIEKFRQEELEHHDTGLENEAEKAPFYPLLKTAIAFGSRLAIEIAKRV